MNKIEEFKKFISNYEEAIEEVRNNETSWQQLYELYDIYGNDKTLWNKYFSKNKTNLKGILEDIKNIDIDKLEENLNSIQRIVSLGSEFTKEEKKEVDVIKESSIDKLYGE